MKKMIAASMILTMLLCGCETTVTGSGSDKAASTGTTTLTSTAAETQAVSETPLSTAASYALAETPSQEISFTEAVTEAASANDNPTFSYWFCKGVYACKENGTTTCYYVFNDYQSGTVLDAEEGIGVAFNCEQEKEKVLFHMATVSDNTLMNMSWDTNGNMVGSIEGNTMIFSPLEGVDPDGFDPKSYSGSTQAATDTQSDPYVGLYTEELSHRCQINITGNGNSGYNVNIRWAGSAFDYYEWNMSGEFNGRGVLNYSDCQCKHYFTEEDGSVTETVEYSNGTGYIQVSERGDKSGILWNDDNYDSSTGFFYEKG